MEKKLGLHEQLPEVYALSFSLFSFYLFSLFHGLQSPNDDNKDIEGREEKKRFQLQLLLMDLSTKEWPLLSLSTLVESKRRLVGKQAYANKQVTCGGFVIEKSAAGDDMVRVESEPLAESSDMVLVESEAGRSLWLKGVESMSRWFMLEVLREGEKIINRMLMEKSDLAELMLYASDNYNNNKVVVRPATVLFMMFQWFLMLQSGHAFSRMRGFWDQRRPGRHDTL